jgi:hypothetical protein
LKAILAQRQTVIAESQRRKIRIHNVIAAVAFASFVLLQFRLLSFCCILVLAMLFVAFPNCRREWYVVLAIILVLIASVLPFDVAVGSYHLGTRRGTSTGGPHLVLFVVGMPMHTRLIEAYGEYISAGCASPNLFPPKWILVWN